MKIAIASDHGGFELKENIKKYLAEREIEVLDLGTDSEASVDYPIYGKACGEAVAEGVYVYADGVITVGEGVNSVRVMYQTKKNAQVLKAKDVDTKTYEATGIVVAQEVGTGEMYDVQVDIPAAVFQLNNQLDASNEGGVPDNVEFTIDMLADATKDYVYQLSFAERV